ncbi:hypothetical protein ES708_35171 [subsurface metagenome]
MDSTPQPAAYAAAEALVLPVEAHIKARLPSSSALATATTIPLSLKEPVGLQPSSLKYSSPTASSFSSWEHRTSGVSPSPKVKRGVLGVMGRKSLYLNRTPGFIIFSPNQFAIYLPTLPLYPPPL